MKLREIERLRAVAILMVITKHWDFFPKFLPYMVGYGWTGVDLFFVISGYVVTLSLVRLLPPLEEEATFLGAYERSKLSLKTFYTRRFFRILPAALTVMLLVRFLITIFPQEFGTPRLWLTEFVAFFGGLYNYAHPFHKDFIMGVYWSLAVEEHFYLLLPIVFVAFRTTSRRLTACVAIGSLSIACRLLLPVPEGATPFWSTFASHLRFDSLMAGVALALLSGKPSTAPIMPRWLMRFLVLPMAIFVIASLPNAVHQYVMVHEGFIMLWLLSGLLVAFAALDQGYVLAVPGLAWVLEYLGSRSYAIYLSHVSVGRFEEALALQWPEYNALVPRGGPHPWQRLVICTVVALLVAELIHRLVEKPFMRIGRALIDPERRAALRLSHRGRVLLGTGAALFGIFYFRHPLLLAAGPRDLALHKPVAMSSHMSDKPDGQTVVNGELESEFGAHTQKEENPWITIDLGEPRNVGSVRVYNRDDGFELEQLPLELQGSNDNEHFEVIARRERVFTQEYPWRIRLDGPPRRYFRLQARATAILCLSEVEIFEGQGMSHIF